MFTTKFSHLHGGARPAAGEQIKGGGKCPIPEIPPKFSLFLFGNQKLPRSNAVLERSQVPQLSYQVREDNTTSVNKKFTEKFL